MLYYPKFIKACTVCLFECSVSFHYYYKLFRILPLWPLKKSTSTYTKHSLVQQIVLVPSCNTPEKGQPAVQYMYVPGTHTFTYSEVFCNFQREMNKGSHVLEGRDQKKTRTISTHLACTDWQLFDQNFLQEVRLSFFCCGVWGVWYKSDVCWGSCY